MGYGYKAPEDKAPTGGNVKFGLNTGAKLTKFEYTANGGKNGAPQEALDIVITAGGKEFNYRKFPITQAFGKKDKNGNQVKITDPEAPEFIAAQDELSQAVISIVQCFASSDDVQAALAQPIASFKEFCEVMAAFLPPDFSEKNLDLFLQWQYKPSKGQTRTYLEIPKGGKAGMFICAEVVPQGKWTAIKDESAENKEGLAYVDDAGARHPFTRDNYFMTHPYAKEQVAANAGGAGTPGNNTPPPSNPPSTGAAIW